MSQGIVGPDGRQQITPEMMQAMMRERMQEDFKGLFFSLVQIGFAERIKAHRSWSDDTASGIANLAHQTAVEALKRLVAGKPEKPTPAKIPDAV